MRIADLDSLWMALTNLVCLYPVKLAVEAGDWTTALAIGAAGFLSALYHLFESHKHGMRGFGCAPAASRKLLWLDRMGVLLTAARMLYLTYLRLDYIYPFLPKYGTWLMAAGAAVALSEHDAYADSPLPWDPLLNYLASHSIWHIAIFTITGHALRELIYV